MIGVVAKLKVQDGKQAEFEAIFSELAEHVNAKEDGCVLYQLYKDKSAADTYIVMEQYKTDEDLKAHGETEYFKAAGPKLGGVLAGAPEVTYYDSVG